MFQPGGGAARKASWLTTLLFVNSSAMVVSALVLGTERHRHRCL